MAEEGQYTTAKPLMGAGPSWIGDEQERRRVASYDLYDAIYWSKPETFKLMSRGAEDKPIYIPSGRIIVETMQRFLAPKMKIVADPAFGAPNDQLLANQVMSDLAKRERIYSTFNANKRFGIIRGDWMFHLRADPARPPGSKISVETVHPGMVFPITTEDEMDTVIGYHIAEMTTLPDSDKQVIRRTTYRKQTGRGGPSPIDVTDEYFDIDEWGGPGMDQDKEKRLGTATPPQTLPAPIDSLPIYHIKNFQEPNVPYGSSEMRGLERIMAAVNQSISDEELALAFEGLGCYATDAGTPVDDDDKEVPWNLGPGRVVELPDGKKMMRLTGVSQVTPYQEHLAYMHSQMDQSTGMSDFAKGKVDVKVAESGIALMLQLAPLLAQADEKEQIVTDVTTNILFDLPKWYVAYEGGVMRSLMDVTRWMPVYGEKIPQNKEAGIKELLDIYKAAPQVIPASYVRDRLRKLGYDDMPDETTIAPLLAADAQAAVDAQGARVDATINAALGANPPTPADTANLQ